MMAHVPRHASSRFLLTATTTSSSSQIGRLGRGSRCFTTYKSLAAVNQQFSPRQQRLRDQAARPKSPKPISGSPQATSSSQASGFWNTLDSIDDDSVIDEQIEETQWLRNLDSFGRWKEEVASRPVRSSKQRKAIRSLLQTALTSGRADIQRFAALYAIKSALLVPPKGMLTLLAERASIVVKHLSAQRDPEAMVLHGMMLEQPTHGIASTADLLQAVNLYSDAVNLSRHGGWTRGSKAHMIVTQGDALCRLGAINVDSKIPEIHEEGVQALMQAMQQYNHYEACKILERFFQFGTAQHYDCLLRLALTGHHASIKKIGDLCCAPPDEFINFDPAVQADVMGGKKWARDSIEAARIARELIKNPKLDVLQMEMSELDDRTQSSRYRAQIDLKALLPNSKVDYFYWTSWHTWALQFYRGPENRSIALDFTSQSELVQNLDEIVNNWALKGVRELQELNKHVDGLLHTSGDKTLETPRIARNINKVRLLKALDWYRLAAIGNHSPAFLAGIKLARQLSLWWDMYWFDWLMRSRELLSSVELKTQFREAHLELEDMRTDLAVIAYVVENRASNPDEIFNMERVQLFGNV